MSLALLRASGLSERVGRVHCGSAGRRCRRSIASPDVSPTCRRGAG